MPAAHALEIAGSQPKRPDGMDSSVTRMRQGYPFHDPRRNLGRDAPRC
jgi:hypothetical protein